MLFPESFSDAATKLITSFEGLHRKGKDGLIYPYHCPAGILTIGWGHTKNVRPDMSITEDKAVELLYEDMDECFEAVKRHIKVKLSQNQVDALVSFIYNLGTGNFARSTLVKKLNTGDYDGAANEFMRWNKARVKGKMTTLRGLTRRRTAEAALFTMDTPIGQDDTLQPQAPEQAAVKPLTHSRTMVGAGVAGMSAVISEVVTTIEPLTSYSEYIKIAMIVLTLIGVGIVAYARWSDHENGIN